MDDDSTAFASREETGRAILKVLLLRQTFLQSKGIADIRHVLTAPERGELTKAARQKYEETEEQRLLQARDKGNRERQTHRRVRPPTQAEAVAPASATHLRHAAGLGGAGLQRPIR